MKSRRDFSKIGLGGGCHWCTEAIYQSLRGVKEVEQGFIASTAEARSPSEAVVVYFDPDLIPLKTLLEIHLYTHKSTVEHSKREKYRSAIYVYSEKQHREVQQAIDKLQTEFSSTIITKILPYKRFEFSMGQFHSYYYSDPEKPFCKNYINPKLQLLLEKFTNVVDLDKIHSSIN